MWITVLFTFCRITSWLSSCPRQGDSLGSGFLKGAVCDSGKITHRTRKRLCLKSDKLVIFLSSKRKYSWIIISLHLRRGERGPRGAAALLRLWLLFTGCWRYSRVLSVSQHISASRKGATWMWQSQPSIPRNFGGGSWLGGWGADCKKSAFAGRQFRRGNTTNNGIVSRIFSSLQNENLIFLYLSEYFGLSSFSSCYCHPSLAKDCRRLLWLQLNKLVGCQALCCNTDV